MNRWTVEVQENSETKELFIELPQEVIDEVKWEIGDSIKWTEQEDGSWILERIEEKKNE